MKKGIFITMVVLSAIWYGNALVFAEPAPNNVPDWTYASVKELIRVGIVDQDTCNVDKKMTRPEMARIVEKAIENSSKATVQQKYLIDKLGIEFALELNNIETNIIPEEKKTEEKKPSPLKIDGVFQYRYEYTKNPRLIAEDVGRAAPSAAGRATDKSANRTMVLLNISNQFDGDTYFHGILCSETLGGRTNAGSVELWEGNFNKKIGPNAELGLGRFMPDLGLGTIGGTPYMDGAKLSFGTDVKVNVYSIKLGDRSWGPTKIYPNRTYNLGDVKFNLSPDLAMSFAFNSDVHKEMYNTWAVGLTYKPNPEIVIDSEYGKNNSSFGELANNGSNPKAYFVRVKYKGANPMVVGSSGLSIEYKYADAGFDPMAMADPYSWNAPFNYTTPCHGGMAENIKGFEYGFETTLASRTLFTIKYDKLKRVLNSPMSLATDDNQDFFTAQATYLF